MASHGHLVTIMENLYDSTAAECPRGTQLMPLPELTKNSTGETVSLDVEVRAIDMESALPSLHIGGLDTQLFESWLCTN